MKDDIYIGVQPLSDICGTTWLQRLVMAENVEELSECLNEIQRHESSTSNSTLDIPSLFKKINNVWPRQIKKNLRSVLSINNQLLTLFFPIKNIEQLLQENLTEYRDHIVRITPPTSNVDDLDEDFLPKEIYRDMLSIRSWKSLEEDLTRPSSTIWEDLLIKKICDHFVSQGPIVENHFHTLFLMGSTYLHSVHVHFDRSTDSQDNIENDTLSDEDSYGDQCILESMRDCSRSAHGMWHDPDHCWPRRWTSDEAREQHERDFFESKLTNYNSVVNEIFDLTIASENEAEKDDCSLFVINRKPSSSSPNSNLYPSKEDDYVTSYTRFFKAGIISWTELGEWECRSLKVAWIDFLRQCCLLLSSSCRLKLHCLLSFLHDVIYNSELRFERLPEYPSLCSQILDIFCPSVFPSLILDPSHSKQRSISGYLHSFEKIQRLHHSQLMLLGFMVQHYKSLLRPCASTRRLCLFKICSLVFPAERIHFASTDRQTPAKAVEVQRKATKEGLADLFQLIIQDPKKTNKEKLRWLVGAKKIHPVEYWAFMGDVSNERSILKDLSTDSQSLSPWKAFWKKK